MKKSKHAMAVAALLTSAIALTGCGGGTGYVEGTPRDVDSEEYESMTHRDNDEASARKPNTSLIKDPERNAKALQLEYGAHGGSVEGYTKGMQ